MPYPWDVIASERLISNRWLTVRRDSCLVAAGRQPIDYYVVEKDDFVMAVALTPEDEVILVRQYKHGCGSVILECPAGYLDLREEPTDAVRRELREETGFRVEDVQSLGVFLTSPSFLSNRAHLFLCTNATLEGPQELDVNEDIEVVLMDFAEAISGVASGTLSVDVASAAALMLAWAKRSCQAASR